MTLPRYQEQQTVLKARRLMSLGLALPDAAWSLGLLSRDLDRLLWEFIGVTSEALNDALPRSMRYEPDF